MTQKHVQHHDATDILVFFGFFFFLSFFIYNFLNEFSKNVESRLVTVNDFQWGFKPVIATFVTVNKSIQIQAKHFKQDLQFKRSLYFFN